MFKRDDDAGRQNVIHACHYLTEEGQSLQVKPIGARALRLGNTRRLIG
ncbi:hypothetical protein P4052_31205 [Pseudomonas aeruginosa]|nr:hypothetical protein [Pseudomonas aeruginosa]MDF5967260.1 hypothetical protein [Pseudomonas aeruginosa]MDF5974566.1 hypothetical protein [Pseudomonas aeruginosa]